MAPVAKKRRLNGRETPQQHPNGASNGGLDHDTYYSSSSEEEDRSNARDGQSYGALLQSLDANKKSKSATQKQNPLKPKHKNALHNGKGTEYQSRDRSLVSNESASLQEPTELRGEVGLYEDQEDQENGYEDDEDPRDPFETHFANIDAEDLSSRIRDLDAGKFGIEKVSLDEVGRVTLHRPTSGSERLANLRQKYKSSDTLCLKKKLVPIASKRISTFSQLESHVVSFLFSYTDLLFGDRRPDNASNLRDSAALHALNHVMKTRDKVIKNNARFQKEKDSKDEPDLELRDQGFTRPKVLVLLETRQMCVQYAEAVIKFYEPEQQENKKRFLDAFSIDGTKHEPGSKPEDFRELFEGNDDNEFRIGLKLTRKNVKFYSQFYNSDIIFASPLGLRRAIDANDQKTKKDYDFLSSIEIVILDQVDAMAMQNWSHVTHALSHLNLMPKSAHGCDFSRVRNWSLNGQAKHLRQTIAFSAYLTPDINALYSTYMNNAFGKVKIQPSYSGAILSSASTPFGTRVKQTFQRYHSISAANDSEDRFEFFTSTVLPALARLISSRNSNASDSPGILLFAPTYFDYTRLRSLFSSAASSIPIAATSLAEKFTVAHLTEYSSGPEASRAMSHFAAGRAHVLLYTSRAHHFRRYRRIRGVKRVVFYGLPDNPAFWGEMVDQVVRGIVEGKVAEAEGEVRCLFSRWDGLALERVVGSERVGAMVKQESSGGDVFEFR